jgi:hypothetical protein
MGSPRPSWARHPIRGKREAVRAIVKFGEIPPFFTLPMARVPESDSARIRG